MQIICTNSMLELMKLCDQECHYWLTLVTSLMFWMSILLVVLLCTIMMLILGIYQNPKYTRIFPKSTSSKTNMSGWIFSTFDTKDGYHQTVVEPSSRWLTAFASGYQLLEWTRTPFSFLRWGSLIALMMGQELHLDWLYFCSYVTACTAAS